MPRLLPEYAAPFGGLFGSAIRNLGPAHAPLLAEVHTKMVDHVTEHSFPGAHGSTMGGREMRARMELETTAITHTDLDAWCDLLWDVAEQFAGQQMRYLLDSVGEASDRVGNTINLRGRPISHDDVLDMLEKMEFKVDEEGNPEGLVMVLPPELMKQVAELPPRTPEQEARRAAIIDRKRRQQNAKKRVRRLDRRS
jgi:hypothetical protein